MRTGRECERKSVLLNHKFISWITKVRATPCRALALKKKCSSPSRWQRIFFRALSRQGLTRLFGAQLIYLGYQVLAKKIEYELYECGEFLAQCFIRK